MSEVFAVISDAFLAEIRTASRKDTNKFRRRLKFRQLSFVPKWERRISKALQENIVAS